jgi:hypothetical protein
MAMRGPGPGNRIAWFDREAFFRAIEETRIGTGISKRRLAIEVGVRPDTFTRMMRGYGCNLDTVAALAMWACIDINEFFRKTVPDDELEKHVEAGGTYE